jgi:CheY-like chemotaxis protein
MKRHLNPDLPRAGDKVPTQELETGARRGSGAAPGPPEVSGLPQVPLAPSGRERDPGLVPLRILVVDDDPDSAIGLGMLLRIIGHDVRVAADGVEALDVADEFRPDVVMLDIEMPRMNGHDAAREIRRQPWGKAMVLIATTGWDPEGGRRHAREAGFDHYMIKPLDPVALIQLLDPLDRSVRPDGASS